MTAKWRAPRGRTWMESVMWICFTDYWRVRKRDWSHSHLWPSDSLGTVRLGCISLISHRETVVSDTHGQQQVKHMLMSEAASGTVCKHFSTQSVRFKIFAHFFVLLVAVSFLLLLPGLNQHGIITKYAGMAKREINKLMKQKEKKNE